MADEAMMLILLHNVEEEYQRLLRRERRIQLPRNAHNPFEWPENLFRAHYRLPKYLVLDLCGQLRGALPVQNRKSALSVEERVLVALRFYAFGSYQRNVGAAANLSQKSVSRCIIMVTQAIIDHLLHRWVKFPSTPQELQRVKEGFMEYFRLPGVIGAIDCTHIAILAPGSDTADEHPEHAYVNRKGYHSLNVQLVCDTELKILSCSARFPRATHDNFIWRFSRLQAALMNIDQRGANNRGWLIGDSGYALEPWLMIPFEQPETAAEERFNKRHRRARNPIERCNGLLKARFRCLLKERVLHYQPTNAAKIVHACIALHNMCVHHRLEVEELDDVDPTEGIIQPDPDDPAGEMLALARVPDRQPGQRIPRNPLLHRGRAIRTEVSRYLSS